MLAFRTFLGASDMLAYLSMMAPRLVDLRRALKQTGSIYLHCDPTASHYLKMLMDAVFGPNHFRNDIIWKRKAGRGETNQKAIRFGVSNDTILFYVKSREAQLSRQYCESNPDYIESKFTHVDENGRRYRLDNITSPNYRANLCYEYKGIKPPPKGWAVSRERMEKMDRDGRLFIPTDPSRRIQRKRFLDELPGETVDSLWLDIPPINSQAQERLGYPTQKPEALLERIILASSEEGGILLDPFCGCGTAIAAAQRLKRRWIGIDITHLAINLIKVRLKDAFGPSIEKSYRVVGEPEDLASAQALADEDKYQFQYWSLGLVGARPDQSQQKKGADRGIDGRLWLTDTGGNVKPVIISVKGGHVNVTQVRDLRGVIEREDAAIGVFICIEEPTAPMRKEAADAGFFQSETVGKSKHPRLQILTIEQLLEGKRIDMPPQADVRSFKQAPKAKAKGTDEPTMFLEGEK